MSELKAFDSERIYWAVEQVERVAGDIDRLHLDDNWFHLKSEVDTAITELKARIHELESIPHTDNSAVIERLSNENERLKAKLESVQATAYAESVDAGMENRRLKRALWLARAERAKAIKWHEGLERYLQERKKYWPSRFSFMKDDEMYHLWYKCWCKVERKCSEYRLKYARGFVPLCENCANGFKDKIKESK